MGRLCGCGRGTKEGVGLVPLMISEVRRNGGAFDVEDPGVHHLAVNLHHHFIVLPIDHVIWRADKGVVNSVGAIPTLSSMDGSLLVLASGLVPQGSSVVQ